MQVMPAVSGDDEPFIEGALWAFMEKEDVDKLMDIAARSRIHSVLVGLLLMVIGITFFVMGAHAIVLEITVTGIVMVVFGVHSVMTQGVKGNDGIFMIVLGILFVTLTYIFETIHGILLFLEFLSAGLVSLASAFGSREGKYGRRKSLVIGVVSVYIAVNLFIAHEESMDILITLMGIVLMALSVYVLWCAVRNRTVINPLAEDES